MLKLRIKRLMLCIYCASINVWGYNINTDIPRIFRDPTENGSYFGYSTCFHFNKQDSSKVLITAPRGTSAAPSSGALYKCDYQTLLCEKMDVESNKLNFLREDKESRVIYKTDGSVNMWLGVALDTQTKEPFDTVVCGHRWMSPNSNYYITMELYAMVGVCYKISTETVMAKGSSSRNAVQKLLPLYSYDRTAPYLNRRILGAAVGMAGISARFSEDTQDLYIGAPGIYQWIGGVVLYENEKGKSQLEKPSVFIPNERVYDIYTGYATATGKFFKNDSEPSVVLGAPKSANGFGKVHVSQLPTPREHKILVRFLEQNSARNEIVGDQFGAFFGATLLTMKSTESSDFHILIVGSPFFSSQQGGDEGKADVYISDGTNLHRKAILTGKKIVDARFGSALACIGDMNLDGFNDIAVGAPYEEDHGAVYIYFGFKDGIRSDYVQRIQGYKYGALAKGFGISIAKGMDIDGNHYPDLLVGAYGSDSAFLFRSHPILQLQASINSSVAQIDIKMTKTCNVNGESVLCFTIMGCVKARGKHLPNSLKVTVTLKVDDINGLERGVFSIYNKLKSKTEELTVAGGKSECVDSTVYIIETDVQDYISPVILEMAVTLTEPVQKGQKDFCPQCPVVDPNVPSQVVLEIPFANDCGDANVCHSDLSVKLLGPFGYNHIVVLGQNRTIDVTVRVKNEGDPAFQTKMTLVIPKNTYLMKLPRRCTNFEKNAIDAQQLLECKVGNPLRNEAFEMTVTLDISSLPNTQKTMEIEASVNTTSFQISYKNCIAKENVFLEALASINIEGYPEQGLTTFRGSESQLQVNHAYDIKKIGPTPINRVRTTIQIPYKDRESDTIFTIIEKVEVRGGSGQIKGNCIYSNDEMRNTNFLIGDDPSSNDTTSDLGFDKGTSDVGSQFDSTNVEFTPDEDPINGEKQALGTKFDMNCVKMECLTVTCDAGPFLRNGDGTTIRIRAQLNMTAISANFGINRNMTYSSKGSANILDKNIEDRNDIFNTSQHAQVTMVFVLKAPPPKLPLANWIIAVSAGAGFLLLGLIAVGLLQLGFFRRKKHEEMKKLLQKATVVKEEDQCENMNQSVTQSHQQDQGVFKI